MRRKRRSDWKRKKPLSCLRRAGVSAADGERGFFSAKGEKRRDAVRSRENRTHRENRTA